MYPDIYFFLDICPSRTSLLSTGRLFILINCPTRTFIESGLLLDPQEYLYGFKISNLIENMTQYQKQIFLYEKYQK